MCGIAGAARRLLGDDPVQTLSEMNRVMLHRGPDMGEIFLDDHIGLCHRRLSIIDLSESGRQPMHSSDGRYTVVFNGEVYNYLEIRKELAAKGYAFTTHTDTEVLLNAYIEYGPDSLRMFNGMFAYVIWDKLKKEVFAARDRIGKKPLYYYWHQGEFAFASEIKSLIAIPKIQPELDLTALVDYLKYLFIPHPKSIYRNIYKLPPGYYLHLADGQLTIREYWDVEFGRELKASEQEIEEELFALLRDTVQSRLIADVPLGAFLSGGVDSSGVVALMKEVSDKRVTTCTIGFEDSGFDEAVYAKAFAAKCGTDHNEFYVHDEPAEIIRKLVWHCDEPFADSSMVPTYYVSKMARQSVTVALSGDGGDESFAGYAKYSVDKFENTIRQCIPGVVLRSLASVSQRSGGNVLLRKLHSLTSSAALSPAEAFYVTNTFMTDAQLHDLLAPQISAAVKGYNPAEHVFKYYYKHKQSDHLSRILYTDLKLLLPGDFLVKVDRMSMANSLEVRSPFLDYRLIELAAQIPSHLKLKGREKKYILRKALSRVLPDEILQRKKHGFEAPIGRWLKKDVKDLAEKMLFQNGSMQEIFQVDTVKSLWRSHQTGERDYATILWTLFVFSLFLDRKQGWA